MSDKNEQQLRAGTGFMPSLSERIKEFEAQGYTENLVPHFDHFTCGADQVKIYPREIFIDQMLRFENSSDPDDQSILYAINCESKGIKGLYVESYGVYHDELSAGLLERIKYCRTHRVSPQRAPESLI